MFSFITQNWRGKPLVSHQAIVSLIASTTTQTGLAVKAALDTDHYETKIKVADEELARLNLKHDEFHGDWNYTLAPR
jgi:Rhodopirellula transposase DDE domain